MFKRLGLALAGVCLGLALAGCGGGKVQTKESAQQTKEPVFSPRQVRRAFLSHGIPLVGYPSVPAPYRPRLKGFNAALVYYRSAAAGPAFLVEVYRSVAAAKKSEGIILVIVPAGTRVRGATVSARRGNVRVIYDSGRVLIRSKIEAALAELSRTQK